MESHLGRELSAMFHITKAAVPHMPSGSSLPIGPTMLAWSFNRDGEARPGLVERLETRTGMQPRQNR